MTTPQIVIAIWLVIGTLGQWYFAGSGRRIEITPGGAAITTLINALIIAWVLAQ